MILKLEIFGAKFNAHFRQYQQESPQKRLLRFGRSAAGNYEFSSTKVMVRQPQSQLGHLGAVADLGGGMGGMHPPHQPKSNDFGRKISLCFE